VQVPDREAEVGRIEVAVRARRRDGERVEVGDEVPADAEVVDELQHAGLLLPRLQGVLARALVGGPVDRTVRHAERLEDVPVEIVPAEDQLVNAAEELTALRTLDHAMV